MLIKNGDNKSYPYCPLTQEHLYPVPSHPSLLTRGDLPQSNIAPIPTEGYVSIAKTPHCKQQVTYQNLLFVQFQWKEMF